MPNADKKLCDSCLNYRYVLACAGMHPRAKLRKCRKGHFKEERLAEKEVPRLKKCKDYDDDGLCKVKNAADASRAFAAEQRIIALEKICSGKSRTWKLLVNYFKGKGGLVRVPKEGE